MDEQSKDLAPLDQANPQIEMKTTTSEQTPVVSPADAGTNTPAAAPAPATKGKGLATSAGDAGANTALGRPLPPSRPRSKPKRRNPWGWVMIVLVALAAGVGTFFYVRSTQTNPAFQGQTTPASTRTPVTISISANGQVQANADLGITFGSGGTVTKLYKKLGDKVNVGDPLVQFDDTDLQNKVQSAQVSYDQAQASYNKSVEGATQKDLDTAQAQLDSAKAKLTQTINGTFTAQDVASANASINSAATKLQQDRQGGSPQDLAAAQSSISSAQASLASAQAKLAKDQAGPDNATLVQAQTSVTSAQASLTQAQANYDKTMSSLKLQISNDQVVRDQALNALKNAQDNYNTAYWNNRNPDGTLKSNLSQAQINQETTIYRAMQDAQGNYNKSDLALNDANLQLQVQQRSLQSQIDSAKASLDNAQAQLDKTRQGPTSADIMADQASVASAQAQLDSAKKNLAALTPTDSTIASDEAQLSSAQASLAKLRGGSPEDIVQSQASVRQAQATLDDLKSGPKPNDIALAKAQLEVSKTNLDQAKAALANALVKSPIAGTIVQAPVTEGTPVSGSTVIYQIVDLSTLHVDVNVAETDISKIKLDMPVAVNLDGVPNRSFTGKVTFISSKATVTSNVVSYQATVTLDPQGTNSLLDTYRDQFATLLQRPNGGQNGQAAGGQRQGGQGQAAGGANGFAGGGNFRLPAGVSAQFASSLGICGYNPLSQGDQTATPKQGMTANVTFCLSLKAGVLSVPNRALKTKTENGQRISYVQVLQDRATNKIVDVPVLTGLAGDNFTEITGGNLKEGDQIVLTTGTATGTSTTLNNFPGGAVQLGGAGGGGGRGGR